MRFTMNTVSMMFNSHKVKYGLMKEELDLCIQTPNEKIFYFFIDFNYILRKYLHFIEFHETPDMEISEDMGKEFLAEFLNLIAHYKNFFYKHYDSISFFYIGINANKKKNESLNNFIKKIIKIITLIPRIYIYYYDNDDYNLYLKYNLIRTIVSSKRGTNKVPVIMDMGKNYMCELYYRITTNYFIFRYDQYKIYIYSFEDFRQEFMKDVDDMYINSVISLLPVYEILNEIKINRKVRIDDIILKFIKTHMNEDFNKPETQLLVLKLFTKMKKLESKLYRLISDLNSNTYKTIMQVVMSNWKNTVKDSRIYNINELMDIPEENRISIETLMKY